MALERAMLQCPIKRNFTFIIQKQFTCECGEVTTLKELFRDLALDIFTREELSLYADLEGYAPLFLRDNLSHEILYKFYEIICRSDKHSELDNHFNLLSHLIWLECIQRFNDGTGRK